VVLFWTVSSLVVRGSSAYRPFQRILVASVPYLLTTIQRRTAVLPIWPGRLAEYVMGRMSQDEAAVALSIHCVVFLLARCTMAGIFNAVPTDPHHVSSDGESSGIPLPWLHCGLLLVSRLVLETAATCGLVVSLLVLPVLLDLNRVPRWSMVALYYPVGAALLSQHWLPATASGSFSTWAVRWATDTAGGLLAGEMMDVYFPEPARDKSACTGDD
jgi:hypothetical protein